jgi:hemoglobin-like flavoprotein
MAMTEQSNANRFDVPAERRALIESVVRPSFERFCAAGTEVFDDFYFGLANRIPAVGSMFAAVDMEQQNQLIRDGIADLIDFADGSSKAEAELQRLAKSHSRSGLRIAPEYYPLWIDALMEVVRKHDDQATDETEAAWRKVLSHGIDLMIAGY